MEAWTGRWRAESGFSAPLPPWDGPATLVVVFGSGAVMDAAAEPPGADGPHGPLAEVVAAYPRSVLIGCSTAGEILGETIEDGTLTIAVTRFRSTRLTLLERDMGGTGDSYLTGRDLAEEMLAADGDLKGVLVLSDGLLANGAELARGLSEACRGRALVIGGLAGDGIRFEQTRVLSGGRPRSGVVTLLGLSGPDVRIGHGAGGGWSILGPERRVTRSEGNVLHELDGRPALGLYRNYLGDRMGPNPESTLLFPLSVRTTDDPRSAVVRTVQAFGEDERSMVFTGDIPQNSMARLMRANMDELIDGAGDAVETAELVDGLPVLALVISCIGRRAVLGQRTEDELETVLARLPGHAQVTGFYSYGEISPTGPGTSALQNQTLTVTTIQELTS
ncbi:hypothetical protein Kisp01_20560 [Kineosporia sp. NBRC 101677]|uniref:FIST signal transduction protein n=1 Tax=Kineosporia sp. NBRC 101677 TaxID=3032197 RepID=UPI0024A3B2AA|nr:FIST N-terminal domain-containing protein [Kineosporia sp. NBRC 101677]GLY15041.1 hypothetical protein Kisp01_20560 [Kineosporia sp. NBRC 101677]